MSMQTFEYELIKFCEAGSCIGKTLSVPVRVMEGVIMFACNHRTYDRCMNLLSIMRQTRVLERSSVCIEEVIMPASKLQ